ncbi:MULTISPECIES: hypothetical protein [Geobacter]|uniref:hypothetical protein n=1 Tax=Geobacter TaxID=28231 RepID=UPI002572A465|nr:hypothetical protein [Geobacter sulfurreducens]BEH10997.1 hypothetical protein GSUET_26090 [Geobacter sulfurreducens subsp. ethanolicus]BET58841.1 hypothetical protein GEO60473_18810 [Geobacter sp. 60473]
MGVSREYCRRWGKAVVAQVVLFVLAVAAIPALADSIPAYLASTTSHDSPALVSPPSASPASQSENATFFSISASPTGDVTLNCGGVPVEIGYTDLAPHDEIREQSQRITRQLDPLINGFSVKVTFLF